MSQNIENRAVQMTFDNKQFEAGAKQTINTLSDLDKSLKMSGATEGLSNVNSAVKKMDFGTLSNGIEAVKIKFTAMEIAAITALTRITNSAITAGKNIASALTIDPIKTGFAEYETQINSVQTILANTAKEGTTLGKVNAALDELNLYADKTIYNFTEMTRNIGTFTAAGVKLDTSVQAIKGIANLAAISGSTSQQASTAMYQLSQALASGTVKLMDWNSVVNAGMGGQVFQDALKETARNTGVNIDGMIERWGSFRETLQQGWLTADILTETLSKFTGDLTESQLQQLGYTEEQIVEIIKLGEMANDAATKVKTFTQLFDTLKEAAQSGWSQSWRIIVGDFEEAKALFTEVSDSLGGIISASADARNELLTGGLSTAWDQLLSAGIADEEGYIAAVTEVAKTHGIAIEDMIAKEGTFQKTLSSGWLTADILSESLENLTAKTRGLSDEELRNLGYTRAQITELESLNESVQNGTVAVSEFANKMGRLSGRENLIQALRNSFEAISKVIAPISEAFKNIFPPTTAEQLYAITENIREFTSSLIISDEASDNLRRTFEGLFAIFSIIGKALSAVSSGIFGLVGDAIPLGEVILSITARIGDFIVGINNSIESSDAFGRIISTIVGIIRQALTYVGQFISVVSQYILFPGFEILASFFETLYSLMNAMGQTAEGMKNAFISAIQSMGDYISNSSFLSFFVGLARVIGEVFGAISSVVGGFFGDISSALASNDLSNVFDLLNSFSFATIALAMKNFVGNITEPFSQIGGFLNGIVDILGGVRGALEAYQQSLKAKILLQIAIAIGILAAALLVIASIDAEKLAASLGAVTVLFADLVGSLALFNLLGSKFSGSLKASTLMISLSVALLILAGALKTISSIDTDKLFTSLLGITALMTMMVVATKALSSSGKTAMKGALQIVIFASAIKILASAVGDLAQYSWGQMIQGLVGVGLLLTGISLFLNNTKFSGKSILTATGIVILAAAINILASATATFGQMPIEQMIQGLIAIGVLLAQVAIFSNVTSNAKGSISSGLGLIALAAGIKILASALLDISQIPTDRLIASLIGMAVALTAITIALNFMPKGMVGMGVGLIAVSTAILILSNALRNLGSMSVESLAISLIALTGSLTALAIALNFMKGTAGGSASLILAATALALLTPTLVILGSMSWDSVAKGLVTLAGTFAIVAGATLLLTPVIPALLGLSGALVLLGVGLTAMGAGLLLISAGLTTLAVGGIANAVSFVGQITVLFTGIIGLIPIFIAKIGEGFVALISVIGDSAGAIGDAFRKIVLSIIAVMVDVIPELVDGVLQIITEVLASIVEYTPQIVTSIFEFLISVLNGIANHIPDLVSAAINVIVAFFAGVTQALKSIDTAVLLEGIAGIGLLAGLMIALGAIGATVPAALIGVAGMGAVITALALVLAAVGGISQIPGLGWLVEQGGEFLGLIGTAIGKFIGGIVGGIASGIAGNLSQIGTDLSQFMINLTPFIAGAKLLDPSALAGVESLVGIVLALTAANILDGLTAWFTGGSSLTQFGMELAAFGPYFKKYNDSVAGIDPNVVTASANAAKSLASFAESLPNSGGLVGWITGENSLAKFAMELSLFGPSLKKYADSMAGVDPSIISSSANAAKALSELATGLPNSGGLASWFTGDNSLAQFAEELAEFGPSLKLYSDSVAGLNPEIVKSSASAALAIAEMADNLPNQGGFISWFTGELTLSQFGEELVAFGPNLKSYSNSIAGLDSSLVKNSASAAESLSEMASELPDQGGLLAWFTGSLTLSQFGTELAAFGPGLKSYSDSIKGLDAALVTNSANASKALAEMAANLPNQGGFISWFTGDLTLVQFGQELAAFGPTLKSYSDSISGLDATLVTNSAYAAQALSEMAANLPTQDNIVVSWFTGGKLSLKEFGDGLAEFGPGFKKYSESISGMDTEIITNSSDAARALSEMAANLPNQTGGFLDWFTGGKLSLKEFGDGLAEFGPGFKRYADSIAGIDPTVITNSAGAAKTLSEMAANLPVQSDGLLSWFTGGTLTLAEFGEGLSDFGPHLKTFSDSISGVDASLVTNAANAGKTLSEMAANLPSQNDGFLSWFTGGRLTLSEFGAELVTFAPSIRSFAEQVSGITEASAIGAANAAKVLAEMAATVPKEGGLLEWFTGSVDLTTFGANLIVFGRNFALYSKEIEKVKPDAVNASTTAANALLELNKGVASVNWDPMIASGIVTFGADLVSFGQNFNLYYQSIQGVSTSTLTAVVNETIRLVDAVRTLSGIDTSVISNFGASLANLGSTAVDSFTNQFTGAGPKVDAAITTLIQLFVSSVNSNVGEARLASSTLINTVLSAIDEHGANFKMAGKQVVELFVSGIDLELSTSTSKIIDLLGADAYLKAGYDSYYGLGKHSISGFIAGLNSQHSRIETAAENLAGVALDGMSDTLEVNSPSKATMRIGGYFADGLASGMRNSYSTVANASIALGNTALEAMKNHLGIASPSKVVRDEVGNYIVEGLAEGITENTSAEEAASKKAQNIVSAFQTELDKLDLNLATVNLESELRTSLYGSTMSESEKAALEMATLSDRLLIQSEKVALAQGEYQNTLNVFGDQADETRTSYNKYLQAQIDMSELSNQLTESQNAEIERQEAAIQAQRDAQLEFQKYLTDNSEFLSSQGYTTEQIEAAAAEKTGYDMGATTNTMSNDVSAAVVSSMDAVQQTYLTTAESTLGGLTSEFQTWGGTYATSLGEGMMSSEAIGLSTQALTQSMLTTLNNEYWNWYLSGQYLVQGLSVGITENASQAVNAALEMARQVISSVKNTLSIHSPSQVFMELGEYVDQGFAKGITQYSYLAEKSAISLGEKTTSSLSETLKKVGSFAASELDTEPMIRPVLDMSDIRKNGAAISNMFGGTIPLNLAGNITRAQTANPDTINPTNDVSNTNVTQNYTFNQSNYSPKSLSRLEIYRQTNNQFSRFKEVTK